MSHDKRMKRRRAYACSAAFQDTKLIYRIVESFHCEFSPNAGRKGAKIMAHRLLLRYCNMPCRNLLANAKAFAPRGNCAKELLVCAEALPIQNAPAQEGPRLNRYPGFREPGAAARGHDEDSDSRRSGGARPPPVTLAGPKLLLVTKRSPLTCDWLLEDVSEYAQSKPPGARLGVMVAARAAGVVKPASARPPATAILIFALEIFFIVFPTFPP
jgi:hypothetical protein